MGVSNLYIGVSMMYLGVHKVYFRFVSVYANTRHIRKRKEKIHEDK